MSETKFVYNARFVGRKPVEGPLNDFRLSEVVSTFQTDGDKKSSVVDEIRCNVEFSDKNLLVTFIKKDEGFESDTESAKSVENSPSHAVEDKSCSGDEKIIDDHVLRLAGEDSDSETSDHNKSSSSGSSSASSTPTVELSKYKFDHLDTYSINDVLICHTDKVYKNCVIWVIRKSGSLEALVFECTNEDNARQLYRKFHEVSKRSKLERHRRRKSDGGSIVTRSSDFSNISSAGGLLKLRPNTENVTINNIDTSVIEKAVEKNQHKWNLVQHTDKNGVTHIEVESTDKQQVQSPSHLVKPREVREVREREGREHQEPRSLLSFSPQFSGPGSVKARPDRSKFARELESILSSEVKKRAEGEASPYTRQRTPGESLSLRQRAPAMLLKKLDEFEEAAHKIWAKAEAEEENRKVWSSGVKSSSSAIGITNPAPPGPQIETLQVPKDRDREKEKEKDRDREKDRERAPSGMKMRQKDAAVKKDADGNRMLIPTKTGKEPPKKLYPKESPPMYSGRYLPLGVSQMGPMAGMAPLGTQPHSLPIYPLQLPGALPWGQHRYPPDMSQLDLSQSVWRHQGLQGHQGHPSHPSHQGHQGAPDMSRSRSRDRGRVDLEQRRRAQSKSPARRHQPAVTTPDISGISRMFRDLSGAVRAKISKRGEQKISSSSTADLPDAAQLKSNLKKQRNIGSEATADHPTSADKLGNHTDNKKVHFNKFATVQMMG